MSSKKRHEGYLLIDNRCAGFGMQEYATYTCSHCDAVVYMNPLRTRERGYCRGCDKYICDACAAVKAMTMECRSMSRVIDEVLTAAEKAKEF